MTDPRSLRRMAIAQTLDAIASDPLSRQVILSGLRRHAHRMKEVAELALDTFPQEGAGIAQSFLDEAARAQKLIGLFEAWE